MRLGHDPSEASDDEVGRRDVSLATVHDVTTLLGTIAPTHTAVLNPAGATALPLLALLAAALSGEA